MRHYYDIYKLLENEQIQSLPQMPNLITAVLKDISQISRDYFNAENDIVLSDIINCQAFDPDYNEMDNFSIAYNKEMEDLLYFNEETEFLHIIARINDFLKLL